MSLVFRMHEVVVFSVIYPSAIHYISEFRGCLDRQTFRNFDVLIVNDGCDKDFIINSFTNYRINVISTSTTPAKNREMGLKTAFESGYKYLIFCDIDDWFHPFRFEISMSYLRRYDIVVNNLNIVLDDRTMICKSYFSYTLKDETLIDNDYIANKNIFGLSNTAIRLQTKSLIEIPENLKIVDWYFFSLCLERGLTAIYCDKALTDYRQHSNNLIGVDNFTLDLFKRMLKLKIEHYKYMVKLYPKYQDLLDNTMSLMSYNDNQLHDIIVKNSTINNHPLWWENIKK